MSNNSEPFNAHIEVAREKAKGIIPQPFSTVPPQIEQWITKINQNKADGTPRFQKSVLIIGETHIETPERYGEVFAKQYEIINQLIDAKTRLKPGRIQFISEGTKYTHRMYELQRYTPSEGRLVGTAIDRLVHIHFPFAYSSVDLSKRTVAYVPAEDRLYLNDIRKLLIDNDVVVFIVGSLHLFGLSQQIDEALRGFEPLNLLFLNTTSHLEYPEFASIGYSRVSDDWVKIANEKYPPIFFQKNQRDAKIVSDAIAYLDATIQHVRPFNAKYRILLQEQLNIKTKLTKLKKEKTQIKVPSELSLTSEQDPEYSTSGLFVEGFITTFIDDIFYKRLTNELLDSLNDFVMLNRENFDLQELFSRNPNFYTLSLDHGSLHNLLNYYGYVKVDGTISQFRLSNSAVITRERIQIRMDKFKTWMQTIEVENLNDDFEKNIPGESFENNIRHNRIFSENDILTIKQDILSRKITDKMLAQFNSLLDKVFKKQQKDKEAFVIDSVTIGLFLDGQRKKGNAPWEKTNPSVRANSETPFEKEDIELILKYYGLINIHETTEWELPTPFYSPSRFTIRPIFDGEIPKNLLESYMTKLRNYVIVEQRKTGKATFEEDSILSDQEKTQFEELVVLGAINEAVLRKIQDIIKTFIERNQKEIDADKVGKIPALIALRSGEKSPFTSIEIGVLLKYLGLFQKPSNPTIWAVGNYLTRDNKVLAPNILDANMSKLQIYVQTTRAHVGLNVAPAASPGPGGFCTRKYRNKVRKTMKRNYRKN